jgi:cytochrome c-type biogenesis protein CcmH/NrfF
VLLHQLIAANWVLTLKTWALWMTMLLTVVSGLNYAWVAARRVAAPAATGHHVK